MIKKILGYKVLLTLNTVPVSIRYSNTREDPYRLQKRIKYIDFEFVWKVLLKLTRDNDTVLKIVKST